MVQWLHTYSRPMGRAHLPVHAPTRQTHCCWSMGSWPLPLYLKKKKLAVTPKKIVPITTTKKIFYETIPKRSQADKRLNHLS